MLIFLALNGIDLVYSQDELVSLILDVSKGQAATSEILHWIVDNEKYSI